ncbi:MAG TPA: hypothetical protein VGB68_17980 [Pyrinomonadaceae bacterium]|jgi:lipopolysaccharide export LptBFGC system permease protein LptF
MEENLKQFFKKWLWLIVLISVLAFGGFVFWLGSTLYGYLSEASFNSTVQNNRTQSQTAVTEAQNAQQKAGGFAVERQIEDGLREKVIAPKLETARRNSQNSKSDLERSKKKYFDETKNTQNLSANRADNCRDLNELFANTNFQYCH